MAIEETLRLKVELDQADLGAELASIRSNVASMATPVGSTDTNISGTHPSNRESIFWGLGAAASQMAGDVSQASQFVGSVAASSLQAGTAVASAFGGSTSQVQSYQSPLTNAPLSLGPTGALGQSMFGGNISPFLSEEQSDQLGRNYFSNVFTGTSGNALAADVGIGAAAGALWFIPGVGPAAAMIGGIAMDTVFAGGKQRLQDVQTLQNLGMSQRESQAALGGGFWSGVGKSLNPFSTSKDHLAGVLNEGMNIDGKNLSGVALTTTLLNQGQLNITGGQAQAGMLAMNELITRTGMDPGSAAGMVQQFSDVGATGMQGNITAMQTMGLLGEGDAMGGMNSRLQNAFMPTMMNAAASGMQQWGHTSGLREAANVSGLMGIHGNYNTFDPNMRGVMGAADSVHNFNSVFQGSAGTGFGQAAINAGAMSMAVSGSSDLSTLGGADLSMNTALGNAVALTERGEAGYADFMFNRNKLMSSPGSMAVALLNQNEDLQKLPREEQVKLLASRLGAHSARGREAISQALTMDANKDVGISGTFEGQQDYMDSIHSEEKFLAYGGYNTGGIASLGRKYALNNEGGGETWVDKEERNKLFGSTQNRMEGALYGGKYQSGGTLTGEGSKTVDTSSWFDSFGTELKEGEYDDVRGSKEFQDTLLKIENGVDISTDELLQARKTWTKIGDQMKIDDDMWSLGTGVFDKEWAGYEGVGEVLENATQGRTAGMTDKQLKLAGNLGVKGVGGQSTAALMREMANTAQEIATLMDGGGQGGNRQ